MESFALNGYKLITTFIPDRVEGKDLRFWTSVGIQTDPFSFGDPGEESRASLPNSDPHIWRPSGPKFDLRIWIGPGSEMLVSTLDTEVDILAIFFGGKRRTNLIIS